MMRIDRLCSWFALGALLFGMLLPGGAAQAQGVDSRSDGPSVSPLQVAAEADGLAFAWSAGGDVRAADATSALASMPLARYGGYMLPMQVRTVIVPDFVDIQPLVRHMDSQVWEAPLQPAAPLSPLALGWEEEYEAPAVEYTVPSAPLFVLREGQMRGQRVAVLAFSPIFQEAGQIRMALTADIFVPGVRPLEGGLVQLLEEQTAQRTRDSEVAAAATGTSVAPPTNPAASKTAVKLSVHNAGMQSVRGSALKAAGLSAGANLARLHLAYRGVEIPLEVRDDDGKLDDSSELRFYAPAPEHSDIIGDRWNDVDIYWLTLEATDGLRMESRAVTASDAPVRSTAMEDGIWEAYQLYESTMPGVDGDYWFSLQMDVDPSQAGKPETYPTATIPLGNVLPLATEPSLHSVFTVTAAARTITTHSLQIEIDDATELVQWTNLQYYASLQKTITTTQRADTLHLTLLPGVQPSGIRLDKVYWQQPVALRFGNKGAEFTGIEGTWRYQLKGTPAGRTLYDVTDPLRPQILPLPSGSDVQFQDGPDAHRYALASPGALFEPTAAAHTATTLDAVRGADAVYIAPALFHEELDPLIAQRQQQGYQAIVVDVQQIYDLWSFGLVSPDAIRNFLRHAYSTWKPAPISAVLVGDGTSDPRNYRGFRDGAYNLDRIPAYFAHVDPWLGETACENCFVQLDGDSPLDASVDPDFLPDMWLGRFSVQDEEQLITVIDKLLRYENARNINPGALWRRIAFYYAEEYIRADGSVDPAGDFAAFSDEIIHEYQSPDMLTARVYYDPRPGGVDNPWQEPDPIKARLRTIDVYKSGAGLVFFNGHANHWQHGSTINDDEEIPDPYMFGYNDIFQLNNIDRLPIIMEMTCFTAQFTKVSTTGTTMDERFQRYENGGGVAIFGPAGLTVAHGHDLMMKGFHQALWSKPTFSARLGELTEAAYLKLFLGEEGTGTCCQDARLTFLVLGDPLMPVLVRDDAPNRVYLPFADNSE